MKIKIPAAVARAYVDSAWRSANGTNWFDEQIGHAAKSRYRESLLVGDSKQAAEVIAALEKVREEQTRKPVIVALGAFIDDLHKAADRMEILERHREAELAAQNARLREEYRAEREAPLPLFFERGRGNVSALAEDYGLDWKDPRIRAALIAAYRTGVREAADRFGTLIRNPSLWDAGDETPEQVKENSEKLFSKARQAARLEPQARA